MGNGDDEKRSGERGEAGERGPIRRYEGPDRAAPYPLSRMAPSFALVDIAAEIQRADESLAMATSAKLVVIADQIRSLQERARAILEQTERNAQLHRVRCNFEKRPGGLYHLYKRPNGELWFSLVGPDEWSTPQASEFVASYRLQADMTFAPADDADREREVVAEIFRLGR